MENSPKNIEQFCKKLPKIELHAHLNGSISDATISALMKQNNASESLQMQERSLQDCFSKFSLIHRLTNSLEVLKKITTDVISDFHNDNVAYLELRSTPRRLRSNTKKEYVQTILNCIKDYEHEHKDFKVNFLVSINRQHGIADAIEALETAKEFSSSTDDHVVGIDFCGDPSKGNVEDFLPILTAAKSSGLKLALHVAEIPNTENETQKLLNLFPDRIGHATYVKENTKCYDHIVKHKIPIELGITSNVMCGTAPSIIEHHITEWHRIRHPIIICTDDKGVFSTTLSTEYSKAALACHLNCKEIFDLSKKTINYTFAKYNTKVLLQQEFDRFENKYFKQLNII